MKGESHFMLGGPPKMSIKLSNLREKGKGEGEEGEIEDSTTPTHFTKTAKTFHILFN